MTAAVGGFEFGPRLHAFQATGTLTQPTRLVVGEHDNADECMKSGAFMASDTWVEARE